LTVGLVSFIVGQGRGSELPAIVEAFVAQAAASRSKAVAEIRSAISLEPATLDRLASALSRATGKELEVKAIVDPNVIGGIVARIGDTVIDGTVARSLASLRQALKSV
jgi:F-type H+-transporting ATPase subunit delta